MKTCSWQEPDDYCFSLVEGRTEYCARHNRMMRKAEETAAKDAKKLANKILQVKSAVNGTLPKSEYPLMIHKPKYRIKKVSDKRKEQNKEYKILADEFKKEHPICEIKANEYCTGQTTDVHHPAGRIGTNYLDVTKWKGACRSCHQYVHDHPKEAIDKGWSESRLAKFVEPHKI